MTYSNIKTLVLDIHTACTPSRVVVFENTADITALQFRLVDGNYYYTLPENASLSIFIDNIAIDATRVKILDRFKGLFQIVLDKNMFSSGTNRQYEIIVDIYRADSDSGLGSSFITELKTSIMYSSGSDDFEQAILDDICPGTITIKPTNPNPNFCFNDATSISEV